MRVVATRSCIVSLTVCGSVGTADAKTYRMLPFNVAPGTGRIELSYGWTDKAGPPSTPLTSTTLDLGLWDQHGYRSAAGFRVSVGGRLASRLTGRAVSLGIISAVTGTTCISPSRARTFMTK